MAMVHHGGLVYSDGALVQGGGVLVQGGGAGAPPPWFIGALGHTTFSAALD